MNTDQFNVILGSLSGDAALDTATSRSILERVSTDDLPETLQVGMPHRVVAFGRRDALSSRFKEATAVAVQLGFDPTVRIAGGRAVVFHPGTIRFVWTIRSAEPAKTMRARFQSLAEAVVLALQRVGVESEIGELAGEYCAGQYSVHLTGGGKVMGAGQRLSRNAAQVGGMLVVNDSRTINEVLVPIYNLLDVPIDPRVTGSIADVSDIAPETIVAELTEAIADGRTPVRSNLDEPTTSRSHELRADHVPAPLA